MNARNAPRAAVPDWRDRVSTAVSVGPMHGVQPIPNSTPSSGAPASPALGIADGLNIRPASMNRSNAPKNSSPSRIVTPPSTRVSVESCALNSWPSPPTASPARENTTEKPTTNSAVPAIVRPVCRSAGTVARALARVVTPPALPSAASCAATGSGPAVPAPAVAGSGAAVASAPDMPVMYARYPGTSGRQHGGRNVTAPALAGGAPVGTDMPPSMADAARRAGTAVATGRPGLGPSPAIVAGVKPVASEARVTRRPPGTRLLWAGAAAFAAAIASWLIVEALNGALSLVDLTVYRDGGLIVRHVSPYYDPSSYAPLYDWGGFSALALKFTYTPFAALAFAVVSLLPWGALVAASVVVNVAALVAALWFTFGGLGYTDRRVRLGATLL